MGSGRLAGSNEACEGHRSCLGVKVGGRAGAKRAWSDSPSMAVAGVSSESFGCTDSNLPIITPG